LKFNFVFTSTTFSSAKTNLEKQLFPQEIIFQILNFIIFFLFAPFSLPISIIV